MENDQQNVQKAVAAIYEDMLKRQGVAWTLGVKTLYKFMSFADGERRDRVVDIVANSRLFFPTPDLFNDPYDVAPVLRHGGDLNDPSYVAELESEMRFVMRNQGLPEEQIQDLRVGQSIRVAEVAEIRRQVREGTRIFCLSAQNLHPLQWSHYADSHRGLSLHFSAAKDTPIGLARAVKYQENRAAILVPIYKRQSVNEIFDRMILVKANFWSYEQEYRIISHTLADIGLEGSFLRFDPKALTGVTMGMCMSTQDQAYLLALLDQHRPDMSVWRAVEDYDRFWMGIEQVR